MSAVQDVLAVRDYKGDSAGGGSQTYGITLDATPFDKLAQYTFYQNRDFWERKNTQDDAAALEIASISALDINTTNKELYDKLNADKNSILNMISSGKGIIYQDDPVAYVKLHQMYGDLSNNRVKASAFDVKNNAELTRIAGLKTPEERAASLSNFNDRTAAALKGGADNFFKYGTLPETGATFTADQFTIPKTSRLQYDTYEQGGDKEVTYKADIVDANSAWASAGLLDLGLHQDEFVPKDNPNNDPTIAAENKTGKLAAAAKNLNKSPYMNETLAKTNQIISLYLDQKKQYDALTPEAQKFATAPIVPEIVSSANAINENLDKAQQIINAQNLRGGKPPVPSFNKVDLTNGLSGQELIYLNSLAATGADGSGIIKYNEVGKSTGLLTSRINNREDNARALKIAGAANQLTRDGWRNAQTGGDTQKNGAWIKAQGIYSDLQKLTDKNGVISPDNLRKLNQEQLKYLGGEKVITDPNGKQTSIYAPLELKGNTVIQLVDGEIRVLESATKLDNGSYMGEFNNALSTNIANIATNRLNEELKNSGSKELNTYVGLDVLHGQTSDTYGAKNSQSGSTTNSTKEVSMKSLKGLVGTKGYEGYTESEIIDYYKSNGYKVN